MEPSAETNGYKQPKALRGLHFTPSEERFLMVLADQQCHSSREFLKVLYDNEEGKGVNVKDIIYKLRKKLKTVGHDIVSVKLFAGVTGYRHVRCLDTNDE
jgi:hypothetical protein